MKRENDQLRKRVRDLEQTLKKHKETEPLSSTNEVPATHDEVFEV